MARLTCSQPADGDAEARTIEKWRFTNPTTHPHPMHLHLVQFQVIDIDGQPQEPSDFGWKDTVVVPAGGSVDPAKFSRHNGGAMSFTVITWSIRLRDDGRVRGRAMIAGRVSVRLSCT
jgi:FtsP/CotA-like multicopper oxidase with cupredoxin domain